MSTSSKHIPCKINPMGCFEYPPGWMPAPGSSIGASLEVLKYAGVPKPKIDDVFIVDVSAPDEFSSTYRYRAVLALTSLFQVTFNHGTLRYTNGSGYAWMVAGNSSVRGRRLAAIKNGSVDYLGEEYTCPQRDASIFPANNTTIQLIGGPLYYSIRFVREGSDYLRLVPYTNGTEIKLYDEVSQKFL